MPTKKKKAAPPELVAAAQAVADYLASPKDRLGRVDGGANLATLNARERVRQLAVEYAVTGSSTTLDQCAAVLHAAIARSRE